MNEPALTWAPRRVLVVLAWICALALVALALWDISSQDRAGALLFGGAAVIVAILATHGTLVRPRLSANHEGVLIRSLGETRKLTWDEVSFQVKKTKRLGREASVLELENQDHLVVYGWLELGQDPEDVFETLISLSQKG